MKKLGWIIVALLIIVALAAVRMKRVEEKASAPLMQRPAPMVKVARVRSGQVARVRHVSGSVVAAEQAEVAPRVMAQVLELRVREGDTVRRGQVLAVLDARELEDSAAQAGAGLHAASAAVAAAEATWRAERDATERDRVLHDAGAISDEQWERSQASEEAMRARLEATRAEREVARKRRDQAQTRRGYALLEAPFGGKITARHADPGDLAVPGKALLGISRHGGLRVRAALPVEDLSLLRNGQPVTVSSAAATTAAEVSRIVPVAESSGLAAFEADLMEAPASFVPGATVGVDVTLDQVEGLIVPLGALLEGEDGDWVFVVRDGAADPLQVEVLVRSPDEAVVTGALAAGDRVIVAQPARLMTLSKGLKVAVEATE